MSLDPLFREIFAASTEDGQALAESILTRNGYQTERGTRYVYGPGTVPIMLIAHTDTVHDGPPTILYHDPAQRVVWSPTGLGADDRAGVYAIADLLRQGFRPHVLLTDCEETGGQGAEEAADWIPRPPVNLLIQLDRQGANDAVYYSCDNPSLERWITRHGYRTAIGTFSDISILMPGWDRAGVNLSVGYYGQHTEGEYLRLGELEETIRRVGAMLTKPPRRKFRYQTLPDWSNELRSWADS